MDDACKLHLIVIGIPVRRIGRQIGTAVRALGMASFHACTKDATVVRQAL